MPTILRFDGYRVAIYPNDHRPAHVHVIGRGAEAIVILQCPDGPPVLRDSLALGRREMAKILDALRGHVPALCERWSSIHGDF